MTKGPYGVALPLVGVLAFLAWERRLKEAVSRWFVGGFLIGIGVVGAWLAALALVEGPHVLRLYIVHQTFGRMANAWAHAKPFWYYAAYLPVEFLPWVAFVPCGFALLRRRHPVAFRFMLALAVTNLVVLSAVSGKLWVYILPIWPALAVAAAIRLSHALDEGASHCFKIETTIAAALLVALGVAAQLLCRRIFPGKTASMLPLAVALAAFGILGIVAAWLPGSTAARKRAVLIASVLVATGLAFSRVATLILTPAFNDTMSPKVAGEQMRGYASEGYALAACGVPFGTYNYYARQRVIPQLDGVEVAEFLEEHPRTVVAIRGTSLDEIRDALPDVLITGEHVLERKAHYLIVKGAQAEDEQGGAD